MNELIAWILAFMMSMSPPTDHGHRINKETVQETTQRYEEIAEDLVEVAFDPENEPLFKDADARSHTVAVMLGIMYHESKFYLRVDQGHPAGRGDGGASWCMMQIMIGKHPAKTRSWNIVHDRPPEWGDPPEEIEEGFTGQELVDNRKLCLYEGLKVARWSFSRCGGGSIYDRLKVYASGSCSRGSQASRRRMFTAQKYWNSSKDKRTWLDADIVQAVKDQKFERKLRDVLLWSPIIYDLGQPVPFSFEYGWQQLQPLGFKLLW